MARPVVNVDEMRELDRRAIEEIGLPAAVLMETAGRRLAGSIDTLGAGGEIGVFCGGGNNGGDGFVCARVLREHGYNATVYLAATPAAKTAADLHFRAYRESGGVLVSVSNDDELGAAEEAIARADVIVDALFGTGLTRPLRGHFAAIVSLINEHLGVVVACDVPSGLNADTGHPTGPCVRADLTVTMAFAKRGLVGEPGFAYAGNLQIVEIGIPSALASAAGGWLFEPADAAELLPWPEPTDHKNRRGSVLVLGGSPGKEGAARLAARAALRAGAGLVTIASPGPIASPDPIMTELLDRDREIEGWLPGLLARASVVVLGPGWPSDAWGQAVVFEVLARAVMPIVIDADGLGHLAYDPRRLATRRGPTILTPHPGEAGRLLGESSEAVQGDRFASARRLAELGAVAVLKGARTVVDDGRSATLFATGNAGMATAGAGDVLAGVIGGFAAQGLIASDAARLGVHVHGLAGDLAAARLGLLSLTADDIVDSLAEAITSSDADDLDD